MLNSFRTYLSGIEADIKESKEAFIIFEKWGLQFLFAIEASDPSYFRIMLPNIANIKEDNKQEINEIVNLENSKFKLAKAIIVEQQVWISAELFVYSKEGINSLFDRILNLLKEVIIDFKKNLTKA